MNMKIEAKANNITVIIDLPTDEYSGDETKEIIECCSELLLRVFEKLKS